MGPADAGLSPDEAFWLLGDETRIAILKAIWESPGDAVSFTAIRERVGSPDSGGFNYHLDKLRGHFVRQAEDGYRLTQAGRQVIRAVFAGTVTDNPGHPASPIGVDCPDCDGSLVVRYEEYGAIECGDCGGTVMWNEFPPAGLAGRTPREFAETFDRWTRHRFRLAMQGICPNCASDMRLSMDGREQSEVGDTSTKYVCSNCQYQARVPLFGHAVFHPAVVSFYYDRGIDITAVPYWRLRNIGRSMTETVVSSNPWRVSIEIEEDGDRLELTLNQDMDVVGVDVTEL